jgi:xylulokinase
LGGGSKSPVWREILAKILNKRINTVQVEETGALGSCILCGLALGVFDDVEAACRNLVTLGHHHYHEEMPPVYQRNLQIFKELYPSLKELYVKLDN